MNNTDLFANLNKNNNSTNTNLDKINHYGISQIHFHEWLKLWHSAIDENFEGTNAKQLKQSARHISTRLFLHICNGRPKS